jgi:hypothetical protein
MRRCRGPAAARFFIALCGSGFPKGVMSKN